jgi:hypothetical protein
MPIPVTAATGGWQSTITGPADGDTIDAASVHGPLGELLANQNVRSLLNLGQWTMIPYPGNGGAVDTLKRRVVFGGRAPMTTASYEQFAHSSWAVIAPVYLSTTQYSYTLSGLPNASGTLTTWSPYAGSTDLGYWSTHTGQFAANAGLFCFDDAAGKSVSTYVPGGFAYRSYGASLSGVVAAGAFEGESGPELIAIKADGTIVESSSTCTVWTETPGTAALTWLGIARSPSHAATAAGTTVYWDTTAPLLAALSNTIVPTAHSVTLRGILYDRHYEKWIVWSADGTYGGLFTAETPGGTWANPHINPVVQFGTDHRGTWVAVVMSFGLTFARVMASADGGVTWRLIGVLQDEFGGSAACNEIAHGDGRFAIIGKTNVYFSGRCS